MEKGLKLIFGFVGVFLLMLGLNMSLISAPTFEESSAPASVTVNEFVDITLTDAGAAGFAFGSLDPGILNKNETAQSDGANSPAATVTREITSNVNVLVRLQGADFTSGGNTLAVTNVSYDDDGAVDQGIDSGIYAQTNLTITYPVGAWATLTSGSPNVNVWFWLDVPSGQAAGSYSSTFSFKGSGT